MHIVPVIDLMGNVVVHAIAGKRSDYRPVKSVLTSQSSPEKVGFALFEKLRATVVYVADLDAIAGAAPGWDDYQRIAGCGLKLWIDAGVSSPDRADEFQSGHEDFDCIDRVIVGLESINSPQALIQTVSVIGRDRCTFSLDLSQGVPLTDSDAWAGYSAIQIGQTAVEAGVNSIIVLDLAHVGTGRGVRTLDLCHQLRSRWPEITLVAGGGVRNLCDLRNLEKAGCDAALVASALHNGSLSLTALENAGHTF